MANNFCRFLSNGYRIQTYGDTIIYKPCCWYRDEVDLTRDPKWQEKIVAISQIEHWTSACGCRSLENSKVYDDGGPRLRSFNKIPNEDVPSNVPVWLELSIDTTCNAACIMCDRNFSSLWRKQDLKFGWATEDEIPDYTDPVVWLEKIKSSVSLAYIRSIDFLGGEPFLSDIPQLLLTELKQVQGDLSNIKIMFQTNGSVKPDEKLLALMRECKKVGIHTSLDGIKEQFEYIRYPLLWSKVENNLRYLRDLDMRNVEFQFLVTVNPFNIYYYDDIEQWCQTEFSADVKININRCSGKIDLAHIPATLKESTLTKFGADHKVNKMLKGITPGGDCLQYLAKLDSARGNNWKTVFPEIVKFFK